MSNSGIRSRLAFAFTIILAGALLFLAFRGANWDEMLATLLQLRIEFVALAFLVSTFMCYLRGLRWRTLLSAEKTVPQLTVFWATNVGYLANSFLPARAGEIIRSITLAQSLALSSSFVLATALTERLIDGIALVLICVPAVLFLANIPAWLYGAVGVAGAMGCVGLGTLFLAPRFEGLINRFITRLPFPQPVLTRLVSLVGQFLLGMRAFHDSGRILRFAIYTLVIWLADALGTLIIARSLNIEITLPQMLLFLAALGLSSAAPSTPGYVGVYQFVAVTVLGVFSISQSEALAFIIVVQALSYLFITILGTVGLWQLNIRWKTLRKYVFSRGV